MKPIQGYKFTVVGTGEFPFDMLRYDRCWPRLESEIVALAPHHRGSLIRELRSVTLIGLNEPTDGRWASFGWKVSAFERVAINV